MIAWIGSIILLIGLGVAIYLMWRRLQGQDRKTVMEALITWLIFSIIFALVPIVFNAVAQSLVPNVSVSFADLLSNGELLIISVGVAAGSVGELVKSGNKNNRILEILAYGSCLILLCFAALLFAVISSASSTLDAGRIASYSTGIFSATLFASLVSIILANSSLRVRTDSSE